MGDGRARRTPLGLWAIVAVALIGLVGLPLFELARGVAVDAGSDLAGIASSPELRRAVAATLWSAAVVTLVSVVLAVAAVLVIERSPRRRRRVLRLGVLLPLLIPPFVSALSWVAAYAEGGLIDDLVGWSLPGLFGATGVILVIAVNAVPLAYLVVAASLHARADTDLELAARNAGAGPATVLRTVTLPAIRPGIIGASALVFVIAINSFGVPAVLGTPSGFTTVTTRIYQDLAFSADAASFQRVLVLAALLVVLTFVVVGAADATGARRPLHRVEAPSAMRALPAGRSGSLARGLVMAYALVASIVPFGALVLTAVTRAVGLPATPENWTTANFAEAFTGSAWRALGTSVVVSALAATGVLLLAGALALVQRRRRASPLGTVAALTFAVPGSALAVAMILAYGPWLRDTVVLILVAYLAKFWALGHRPLAAASTALAPDVVWAARVSGAGRVVATRTVLVPLLGPAVLAGWVLVFLFGLHELTMSSLLYGPGTATLAVVTLNLQQLGDPTVTAALAVGLTAAVAVAALPLVWAWRSWSRLGTG